MASRRPLYQRIADRLRADITGGELPPGSKLPSEAELAAQWETTRSTAVAGMRVLVNEGLIVADRPRGYFVRRWEPMIYRPQREFHAPEPDLDIFRQRVAEEGDGRQAGQSIEVSIANPAPDVRDRLSLSEGQLVAVRRRTRTIGEEAYNIQDSHVPLNVVQGSDWMSPEDVARGTNRVLGELGYEIVKVLDEIAVRMPTPDEVTRLSLGPGTPVAEHVATGYTMAGEPVQVTRNILPGDRHVIIYERNKRIEEG
ncbi:GntR family transcriptional regulator [Streptomyces sp. SM12]|uniref:GntR family transcriptional regulator n=1 Tax=Streptomyces sp. SM12 TaxID=1071602 RepID=UPI000CD5926C|nr:GntR family transcriptional regulator [Streptomyces sp. SM12]